MHRISYKWLKLKKNFNFKVYSYGKYSQTSLSRTIWDGLKKTPNIRDIEGKIHLKK